MKIGIFHVTSTFKVGGSETYVWRLARHLGDHGHTCHLWGGAVHKPIIGDPDVTLCLANYTPRERVWKIGGRFQKLVERLSFGWHAHKQLLAERYDIFNVHKPYDLPLALWLRRRTGCKVVWRCHGTDFFPGLGALVRRVDAIYCVSRFAKRGLTDAYPVKARVIHTGVDSAFFDPAAEPVRPAAVPRILYFGRLEGWKGVRHLAEALERLKDLDWDAEIVGDGPKRGALEQQIQVAQLSARVQLRPAVKGREDVRRLLAGADIIVFPSVADETFSNAVLEAMSMGKAIVATDVGGFPEAIKDGESGLLVTPRSGESLANGIRTLLTDPGRRASLGMAARARVTAKFDATASFAQVEQLFRDLCDRPA